MKEYTWALGVYFVPWDKDAMADRRSAAILPEKCATFDQIRRALRRDLPKETMIATPREFDGSAYHVELVEDAKDATNKRLNYEQLHYSGIYDFVREGHWGVIGGKAFVFFLKSCALPGNTHRPHITIAYFPNGCDEVACKQIVAKTIGTPLVGWEEEEEEEEKKAEGTIQLFHTGDKLCFSGDWPAGETPVSTATIAHGDEERDRNARIRAKIQRSFDRLE